MPRRSAPRQPRRAVLAPRAAPVPAAATYSTGDDVANQVLGIRDAQSEVRARIPQRREMSTKEANVRASAWFVLLCIGSSWLFWGMMYVQLDLRTTVLTTLAVLAGFLCPMLAAGYVLTQKLNESQRQLTMVFFPPFHTMFLAWLIPVALVMASIGVSLLMGAPPDNQEAEIRGIILSISPDIRLPMWSITLIAVSCIFLIGPFLTLAQAFGMEAGWRVFLLPRLIKAGMQQRHALSLTGFLQGIWLIPPAYVGYFYAESEAGLESVVAILLHSVIVGHVTGWLFLKYNNVWPSAIFTSTLYAAKSVDYFFLYHHMNMLYAGPFSMMFMVVTIGFVALLFQRGHLPARFVDNSIPRNLLVQQRPIARSIPTMITVWVDEEMVQGTKLANLIEAEVDDGATSDYYFTSDYASSGYKSDPESGVDNDSNDINNNNDDNSHNDEVDLEAGVHAARLAVADVRDAAALTSSQGAGAVVTVTTASVPVPEPAAPRAMDAGEAGLSLATASNASLPTLGKPDDEPSSQGSVDELVSPSSLASMPADEVTRPFPGAATRQQQMIKASEAASSAPASPCAAAAVDAEARGRVHASSHAQQQPHQQQDTLPVAPTAPEPAYLAEAA